MSKQATFKQLILYSILLGLIVLSSCATAILTPHTFVRVMNLILIVALSMAVGAFVREMFLVKAEKQSPGDDQQSGNQSVR